MINCNYIDLFSGIGGFALGAAMAGMKFKNHYFSEIDKFCIKLYKKRFPSAIELGDIREINFEKNNEKWILTGGFPCQDISYAGKQEGIYGQKSGLWFEYFRAIRSLRPEFAIIENVRALARNGLSTIIENLASIGYAAEWTCISARDFGFPHVRERLWIIAYPETQRWNGSLYFNIEDIHNQIQKTNAVDARRNHFLQFEKVVGRPPVCGMDDGLPHRLDRLGSVGNAIIPHIAQFLFRIIKKNLNQIGFFKQK